MKVRLDALESVREKGGYFDHCVSVAIILIHFIAMYQFYTYIKTHICLFQETLVHLFELFVQRFQERYCYR